MGMGGGGRRMKEEGLQLKPDNCIRFIKMLFISVWFQHVFPACGSQAVFLCVVYTSASPVFVVATMKPESHKAESEPLCQTPPNLRVYRFRRVLRGFLERRERLEGR